MLLAFHHLLLLLLALPLLLLLLLVLLGTIPTQVFIIANLPLPYIQNAKHGFWGGQLLFEG